MIAMRMGGTSKELPYLGVALLNLDLLGIDGFCGVVRHGVALGLELLDGSLELRDGGTDVRKLDDVGMRGLGELAELCQVIGLLLESEHNNAGQV